MMARKGRILPVFPQGSLLLFLAGALTVLGFAPFGFWWLPPLTLAPLFIHWARHPKHRGMAGFIFGLGLFVAGVHWIYISLHDHGGMPALLGLIALIGFSAFVALMPACAGLLTRCLPQHRHEVYFAFPAAWTLLEWSRTWFCTGFPWLAVGYSQVPYSPLIGLVPIFGVYGASLGVSFIAAGLAQSWIHRRLRPAVQSVVITLGLGFGLQFVAFVHPTGHVTPVTLIQGNIPQDDKFDLAHLKEGLERYLKLADASSDPLIVMPESSIPLLKSTAPVAYLDAMKSIGVRNQGDILVGIFDDPHPDEIHNSMLSLGVSPSQMYYKHHLVPFGEFIPLKSVAAPLINALLKMPIGSQASGPRGQGPIHLAGTTVALNICYEDTFGEEIIDALPEAKFLINVSNDAWFGRQIGPEQHLQMAATRSLETGREMARVTNTGISAFIDIEGHVVSRAPQEEVAALRGEIRDYEGTTPFVRWSNTPLVVLCFMLLALSWAIGRRSHDAL